MIVDRARASGAAVVYLNLIGGQDELVFDGALWSSAPTARSSHRSPQLKRTFVVDVPTGDRATAGASARLTAISKPSKSLSCTETGLRRLRDEERVRAVVSDCPGASIRLSRSPSPSMPWDLTRLG